MTVPMYVSLLVLFSVLFVISTYAFLLSLKRNWEEESIEGSHRHPENLRRKRREPPAYSVRW